MDPAHIESRVWEYGILGVVALAFAWTIVRLWQFYNAKLDTTHSTCKTERDTLIDQHKAERDALINLSKTERSLLIEQSKAERELFVKRISDLQEARIADSKAMQEAQLSTTRETMRALGAVTSALDMTRVSVDELAATLRDEHERKAGD